MPFLFVKRNNVVNRIVLYTTLALAGGTAMNVRYNNVTYYARLAAVGSADDSGLRVRKGGTVYQVCTRKIPAYTSQLLTTSRNIAIPWDVKRIRVTLIGGGGASSVSYWEGYPQQTVLNANPAHPNGSWAGGNGAIIENLVLAVTPGVAIACTVGAGAPAKSPVATGVDYISGTIDPQQYIPGTNGIGKSTSISQGGQMLVNVLGGYSSYNVQYNPTNSSVARTLKFWNYSQTYSALPPSVLGNCGKGGAPARTVGASGIPLNNGGIEGNAGNNGGIFLEWGVGIE